MLSSALLSLCIAMLLPLLQSLAPLYHNGSCDRPGFFPVNLGIAVRGKPDARSFSPTSLHLGMLDQAGNPTHLSTLSFSQGLFHENVCLPAGQDYFYFNPRKNLHVALVCRKYSLKPGETVVFSSTLVVSGRPHCQRLSSVHGSALQAKVQHLYAARPLEAELLTPTEMPTSRPSLCTDQPSSMPTALPTIFVPSPTFNSSVPGNGTANGANLFTSTTFISSVAAAGGAGVATAAGVSYYLLKSAKDFVKVPMAPSDMAMQI